MQKEIISDNDLVLILTFETNILYCYNLDICDYYFRTFSFYQNYWTFKSKDKKLKFGISNKMSYLYYQHYLAPLKRHISAKKAVIVRAHPVIITILKLILNNSFNLGLYGSIYGQSMLLLQNQRSLLPLFLSIMSPINDIIRVL